MPRNRICVATSSCDISLPISNVRRRGAPHQDVRQLTSKPTRRSDRGLQGDAKMALNHMVWTTRHAGIGRARTSEPRMLDCES